MCIMCCACPSGRTCTFVSAVITGIEAAGMAILNLLIILACSCNISPPNSLRTEFMEQVWSWFLYDAKQCEEKQEGFAEPGWILPVPPEFIEPDIYNIVDQDANYVYQIIEFIVNVFWCGSAFLLFFGNATRHYHYHIPWLVLCAITITLDTIFGSFYIRFMDDLNGGWDTGKAIFSMQFLYFRGFVFYLYNVISFFVVGFNSWNLYREYRREKKLLKKAVKYAQPAVTVVAPHTEHHHHNERFYHQNVLVSDVPQRTGSPMNPDYPPRDYERAPAPTKYRPFSYTNPAYRPNDPHDVEGMKMNSAVEPYAKGYTSGSFGDIEEMETKIPRISLPPKN